MVAGFGVCVPGYLREGAAAIEEGALPTAEAGVSSAVDHIAKYFIRYSSSRQWPPRRASRFGAPSYISVAMAVEESNRPSRQGGFSGGFDAWVSVGDGGAPNSAGTAAAVTGSYSVSFPKSNQSIALMIDPANYA